LLLSAVVEIVAVAQEKVTASRHLLVDVMAGMRMCRRYQDGGGQDRREMHGGAWLAAVGDHDVR